MCAEALLPLAITAVFTTGGPHNSEHAKWGESGEKLTRTIAQGGGG